MLHENISIWLTTQIRQHIPISDQDAVKIANTFSTRNISKGELLLKEGHYGDWWGFVHEGLLRSYSSDENEIEWTNGFIREGRFTCEFVSFYGGFVSPTNVVSLEDTLIICVDRPALDTLFSDFPYFEKFARILYQQVLTSYKQHNIFRVRLNARERYLHFLKTEPELIKRVPLKYIASYLNITDTSLSRIRRNTRS